MRPAAAAAPPSRLERYVLRHDVTDLRYGWSGTGTYGAVQAVHVTNLQYSSRGRRKEEMDGMSHMCAVDGHRKCVWRAAWRQIHAV